MPLTTYPLVMSETAPKTQLMQSLGRLVRGLSALFWGLPIALLVCVKTTTDDSLRVFGPWPSFLSVSLLYYGLLEAGHFQRQERVWCQALDRAKLIGLINAGLSPFLYFWNVQPDNAYFRWVAGLLAVSGLVFLFDLNYVLQRLVAMLPDETLRVETRFFTTLNFYLLVAMLILLAVYTALLNAGPLPLLFIQFRETLELGRQWLLMALVLLPLAMTMTLIWKIKEAVLESIFAR
jgi:hypothetical protein